MFWSLKGHHQAAVLIAKHAEGILDFKLLLRSECCIFFLGDSVASELYVQLLQNTVWFVCAATSKHCLNFMCSCFRTLSEFYVQPLQNTVWIVCAATSEHCLNCMCSRFRTLFELYVQPLQNTVWILCAAASEHCLFHLHLWCKQEG